MEQLAACGEDLATRAAHARYCTQLVTTLGRAARVQKGPLDRLQTEHANLRAALEWLDGVGHAPAFVHLAALLPPFWYMGGHLREGRVWLERALAKAEEAAALDRALVQIGLGLVLTLQGEYDAAEPLFAAGIPLLRASGQTLDLATALIWYGTLANYKGDHSRAEGILSEALGIASASDEPGAVANKAGALGNLGTAALGRGEFDLAETRLAEALQLRDAHGFDLAAALSVLDLAIVAYSRGDYPLALARYRESLIRVGNRGELHYVAEGLSGVASAAAALAHARAAARLFGAAQALLQRVGIAAFDPAWQAIIDRNVATVQRALGDEAFETAWAEGRTLSWAEVMDTVEALSQSAPGATPTGTAPAP
jgi:non-specific serine/threonine protein kinase